ncbi:MAG: hypothetical protein AAGA25_11310 [Planctomycetota bacterium]
MASELCYTSSPQGLKPGTHGYCTVAASEALTPYITQRLEALSGYRPLFGVGDPNASRNPVTLAHLRLLIGGETHSVLSRVAYAGADHTGRLNKFAHHLLLSDEEQATAGPAWVLSQSGVMREVWNDVPRRLSEPRSVPNGETKSMPCMTWEKATGDAGWAGVLAENHLLNPAKPVYLIYDPAQHEPLAMTAEALALLPPSRRWEVTFSTYFTDPLPDAECGWRWIVAGTPIVERVLREKAMGKVIDLTQPMGQTGGSRYVYAARNGGELPTDDKPETQTEKVVNSPAAAERRLEISPSINADPAPHTSSVPVSDSVSPVALRTEATRSSNSSPDNFSVDTPKSMLPRMTAAAAVGGLLVLAGVYVVNSPEKATANRTPVADDPLISTLEDELADSRTYAQSLEEEIALMRSRLDDLELSATRSITKPVVELEAKNTTTQPEVRTDPSTAFTGDTPPEQGHGSFQAISSEPMVHTLRIAPIDAPIERSYVSLRPPTFAKQSAAGLGALARLNPDSQVLWEVSPQVAPVKLRIDSPLDELPRSLMWSHDSQGGVSVIHVTHDSLGITKRQTLGTVQLNAEGLTWRWESAPFHVNDQATAEPLTELHNFVRYAVLIVEDNAGREIAQVQPCKPQRLEVSIGNQFVALDHLAKDLEPTLIIPDSPDGWTFVSGNASTPARLRGRGGAELLVDFNAATGEFESRWAPSNEPLALASRLKANQQQLAELDQILAKSQELQDTVTQARSKLPLEDNSRNIDRDKRDVPRWRDVFDAFDKARDARDLYLAEHAPEGLEPIQKAREGLTQQLEIDQAMQGDLDAFDTAVVRIVALHSTADLAFITLEREANP